MQVFTGLGNLGDTTSTLLPKYSSVSIERTLLAKNLNIPSEPHANFRGSYLGREWTKKFEPKIKKYLRRPENDFRMSKKWWGAHKGVKFAIWCWSHRDLWTKRKM